MVVDDLLLLFSPVKQPSSLMILLLPHLPCTLVFRLAQWEGLLEQLMREEPPQPSNVSAYFDGDRERREGEGGADAGEEEVGDDGGELCPLV